MTQPEIYIGFTPSLAAGHGNHQQAGRYIWEGVKAAADPTMFPEQLTGPHALRTWQVKKVFSGGSTAGTGGTTTAPDCTTGFLPAATNLTAPSPACGPATSRRTSGRVGNLQGQPPGVRQDVGAGRDGGRTRLSDAEPRDVPGPAGTRAAAASA